MSFAKSSRVAIVGAGISGSFTKRFLQAFGYKKIAHYESEKIYNPECFLNRPVVLTNVVMNVLKMMDRPLYKEIVNSAEIFVHKGYRDGDGHDVEACVPINSNVFMSNYVIERGRLLELLNGVSVTDLTVSGGIKIPVVTPMEDHHVNDIQYLADKDCSSISFAERSVKDVADIIIAADGQGGVCAPLFRGKPSPVSPVPHGGYMIEGFSPKSILYSNLQECVKGNRMLMHLGGEYAYFRLCIPREAYLASGGALYPLIHTSQDQAEGGCTLYATTAFQSVPKEKLHPGVGIPRRGDLCNLIMPLNPYMSVMTDILNTSKHNCTYPLVQLAPQDNTAMSGSTPVLFVGSNTALPAPDSFLSQSSGVLDGLAAATGLYMGDYLTTMSKRASQQRVEYAYALSQAEAIGETSKLWSYIGKFSNRYSPPSMAVDDYEKVYHHVPPLKNIPGLQLFHV